MHSTPHAKRIPRKSVNRFIFVRFRGCKNSSPVLTLAYKSTDAVASAIQKYQTATALLTCRKVCAAAFVSVVSAVCLVHFLTLVSNLSKSQITSRARFVSVVSVRVDTFRGVRFSCVLVVSRICLQSYNLSTTLPNNFEKIFY